MLNVCRAIPTPAIVTAMWMHDYAMKDEDELNRILSLIILLGFLAKPAYNIKWQKTVGCLLAGQ